MKQFDYVGLGFCSNDHLAVLPFIPMDTKVRMISHAILGGGPAGNSTAAAATLGLSAAFVGTVGDDADGDRLFAVVDMRNLKGKGSAQTFSMECKFVKEDAE